MALGDVIQRLAIALSLETSALEKGADLAEKRMEQSRKRFEAFGKKISGIGKTMSLALTAPIAAFGYSAVKAAQESTEAMGQVDAALKSMGNAAGRTREQLRALASKQMRTSLYDDDEILRRVTANLLTFGNVAGDNFDRAQQAAIDLSARLGQDLQQSAVMVGKALNDPIKGLSALRRVGIQFTEQQEKQIKAMAEAGNAAGAQAVMLAELERQFVGSAQAMRDADPMAAAKMSWAEFQETIGEKLLPILPVFANAIIKVLDAFSNLSPAMQKAIVIGAALAAAIGPVLVVFGSMISLGAPLLAFLKTLGGVMFATGTASGAAAVGVAGIGGALTSVAAAALPIAAIAAAGYLAWKNWDDIAPRLQPLIEQLTAIGEGLGLVEKKAGATSEELAKNDGFRKFGAELRDANNDMSRFIDWLDKSSIAFGEWWSSSYENWAQSQAARSRAFWHGLANDAVVAMRNMVTGIGTWVTGRLNAIWAGVTDKIASVKAGFRRLYDAVVGHSYIPDMVDGIAAQMARLDAVMVVPVSKATTKAQQAFREMAQNARAVLDRLFPEAAAKIAYETERAALIGAGAGDAALRALANERDLARRASLPDIDFGRGANPLATGLEGFDEYLDKLTKKADETRVRVAKSFKDMADETLGALNRLSSAIKGGGFLGILEAVVGLGLQLGSIGVFGKSVAANINRSVPGYANGTGFHPGGLAMVGERGPELVSMPRGSRVTPNSRIGGTVNNYFNGNLMTPEFWAQINAGDIGAARAGAQGGVALMGQRQSRRL